MYSIIRQGDTDQYDIIEFCCDMKADISELPTNVGIGSACIVIEDSSVWMLGNDKVWHEI